MQPHEAATTPLREKFTPQGIELLVKTFLDLQHNVFQAAAQFGLTLAQLEEALAWPEARELIDRAQRLSQLRTQPALDLIFPCALDRLAAVMFDENAPAEVRRKSAALLARLCESRRRDRRPRPAKPNPEAAPNTAPAHTPTTPPRETTTHDDIAEETLPAPLLRYIPADPAPAPPTDEPAAPDADTNAETPTVRRAPKLAPLRTFPLCAPTASESAITGSPAAPSDTS
ncbi:MAG: hypothetical protein IBJ10_03370 [Phycisphaerales bacterium]|nr:hypothetical protein [Phycisphaerales bacterium]